MDGCVAVYATIHIVRAIPARPDPGDGCIRRHVGYVMDLSTQSRTVRVFFVGRYSDVVVKVNSPQSCSRLYLCIITKFP